MLAAASATMLLTMFVVSEEAAVAIRAAYEQAGELSALIAAWPDHSQRSL